jgi:phosphoribosyl 1,2-cyclic phosphodiesterase
MLETGIYPYMVKQRVASDRGHLSNAQAAEALEHLLSQKLEQVVAMHISENNNTYTLPVESLRSIITINTHQAKIHAAYQHRTLSL